MNQLPFMSTCAIWPVKGHQYRFVRLACQPNGKVIDEGCTEPVGILEVKCPHTKFLASPKDACSDPNFYCKNY